MKSRFLDWPRPPHTPAPSVGPLSWAEKTECYSRAQDGREVSVSFPTFFTSGRCVQDTNPSSESLPTASVSGLFQG